MNNSFEYTPIAFDPIPPSNNTARGRGFAIASLVCGILGMLMCCCCVYWFNLILGILAVVFSVVSARQSKKIRGLAIAGLILGIAGIVIALVSLLLLVVSLATIGSMTDEELLLFLEETFKPLMSEEEYAEFLDAFQEAYGRAVESAQ